MKILDEKSNPTKSFFMFLKYNVVQEVKELSEYDKALYKEFISKWKTFAQLLEKNDNKASGVLGSIASLFGFNRRYCSICGSPIMSRYSKIQGKISCPSCYDSYKIIQLLEKKQEKIDAPPKDK